MKGYFSSLSASPHIVKAKRSKFWLAAGDEPP
jgi:hypothetical protein